MAPCSYIKRGRPLQPVQATDVTELQTRYLTGRVGGKTGDTAKK